MARRSAFQRPRSTRILGRKIIIACEGKKTEYGYFQEIRKSMRLPTLQIFVVHPDATDPRSIVRAAVEERRKRRADRSWMDKDEAWAVFDGDEHIISNPANWNDALQIAGFGSQSPIPLLSYGTCCTTKNKVRTLRGRKRCAFFADTSRIMRRQIGSGPYRFSLSLLTLSIAPSYLLNARRLMDSSHIRTLARASVS
jgi:hypothetical protein